MSRWYSIGRDPWWPEREFRELVEGALAEWRRVPRFEYLLVDQTLAEPEAVEGTPTARLTQTALMVTVRGGEDLADRTARLMAEVSPEGEVEVLPGDGCARRFRITLHLPITLSAAPPPRNLSKT